MEHIIDPWVGNFFHFCFHPTPAYGFSDGHPTRLSNQLHSEMSSETVQILLALPPSFLNSLGPHFCFLGLRPLMRVGSTCAFAPSYTLCGTQAKA